MTRRRITIGLAVAAVASAVAVPLTNAAPQSSSKTANVEVGDDFFAPSDVTIKKNSKIKWAWADDNTDTHNVVLTSKHPKDVKASDFRSGSYSVGATFKRKFTTPGKYAFVCTYHKTVMKMDVTVKK